MAPRAIALADVLNFFEYEEVREDVRRRVMALKRARRVAVGRYLQFLFENRDTVLYQIQEMCRVERITSEAKIQEEIDVYAPLLPGDGELSATMMIEIEDNSQVKPVLDRFMGIDAPGHVALRVGELAIPGDFETGRSDEGAGKLSAVHFVRFALSAAAIRAFPTAEVFLAVDHLGARDRTRLSEETKSALLEDLRS
jgi:hypothetical protein